MINSKYAEILHLHRQAKSYPKVRSLACCVLVYKCAIYISKILAPLEVFKSQHFERFSDYTCKIEMHSCYLSKNEDFECTCMVLTMS